MSANTIDDDWPSEDTEAVCVCPVCGKPERELLYDDLKDWSFHVAPGSWILFRCLACRSGYLDPRPTELSIHRAYQVYYTHSAGEGRGPQGTLRRLKYALANDYRLARFGLTRHPRVYGGRWLAKLFPAAVRGSDLEMRYLPRPRPKAKLLDIGSGNGAFLALAKSAGWEVAGVEPDPAACKASTEIGAEVRANLADWSGFEGSFEAATLNHTIEHVHDPATMLINVAKLLKPGAHLFLETPNIDAVGHGIYGRYWRGLETPRHLVLFSPTSITDLLNACGFVDVTFRTRPSVLPLMAHWSRRMAVGLTPHIDEDPGSSAPRLPRPEEVSRERAGPDHSEFITLTAKKA